MFLSSFDESTKLAMLTLSETFIDLTKCNFIKMFEKSLFLIGALLAVAATGDDCVIENNVDYIGTSVNNGLDDLQPDPYSCQAFCR